MAFLKWYWIGVNSIRGLILIYMVYAACKIYLKK